MRSIMLVLIVTLFSGCALIPAPATVVLGGVNHVVDVPAGGKVCGVPLPTDEGNKTYCIVTTKASRLVSLEAWDRLEKGCK